MGFKIQHRSESRWEQKIDCKSAKDHGVCIKTKELGNSRSQVLMLEAGKIDLVFQESVGGAESQ